jgi:hydrogenase-4 component F
VTSREILAYAAVGLPALAAVVVVAAPRRFATALALGFAVPAAGAGIVLGILCLKDAPTPGHGLALDAAGGLLVVVTSTVGLASVAVSPSYLATLRTSFVSERHRRAIYFALLYAFWSVLVAIAVSGNLGVAWLLVEASTAPSAVLVGFSGRPRSLEAGWKYLVLTSLGLGVALLGILILAAGTRGGLGGLSWAGISSYGSGPRTALVAYLLLLAGLAAKVGWAPVHNWLPDAHSEAPAPVSALLSAALLPTVVLVAWRASHALGAVVGVHTARSVLIGFGLVSLAVAVPFLWRTLAWKRLLAYSSLEHMGVLALGIGFATPLALAGVVVHVGAHAVAKALGFYAATPLLGHEPRAGTRGVTGIGRTEPVLGAAMGLSLGTLAGLPPSPLFFSEVLIVAGGFEAGRSWAAAAAALLLGLAFVGLVHSLIETTAGKAHRRAAGLAPGLGVVGLATGVSVLLLAALAVGAFVLPGTNLVVALAKGLS